MLKKFLKEVIGLIAGKPAEDIVDLLDTKKHINEFVIAKKLNLTINQTRNILYKITDYGLVSSIRKKDKRKGWYTYFWKIETLKSLEFLRTEMLKKINNFEHQIKSREVKRFYICERCHVELTEEHALLNNFTCNECGSLLVLKDNTKMISEMRRNLERIKRDMVLINDEIMKENAIIGKKKQKDMRKEEAERRKVLKKKQKERKALKNKMKKALGKKTLKKKGKKKVKKSKKLKKRKKKAPKKKSKKQKARKKLVKHEKKVQKKTKKKPKTKKKSKGKKKRR